MTDVRQVTPRPTAVLDAVNLETGKHALILTTPEVVNARTMDLARRRRDAPGSTRPARAKKPAPGSLEEWKLHRRERFS